MQSSSYLMYVKGTIQELSNKETMALYNFMANAGVIDVERNIISPINEANLLSELISSQGDLCAYEDWEFVKDYNYSVFFHAPNFREYREGIRARYGHIKKEDVASLSESFSITGFLERDNRLFVKCSAAFSAYHPTSGSDVLMKYTTIIVLHDDAELIEFRFDTLKRTYWNALESGRSSNIYVNIIENIRKEFATGDALKPLDTSFMIEKAKNSIDGAILLGQRTELPKGGSAQLEAGRDHSYMLPLLGQIQDLLITYKRDFASVPDIESALEQILYENDEMADFAWIIVLWPSDIKTRSNKVRFSFRYANSEYDLVLHYYSALSGMERMNHVAGYIGKHQVYVAPQSEFRNS